MSTKVINIADDFSTKPYGRYPEDGDFNGERFRNEFLIPAIRDNEKVIVDLDGTRGYGSSFLDEAFGGLIRESVFSFDEVKRKLEIKSKFESYIEEITSYIQEANDNLSG